MIFRKKKEVKEETKKEVKEMTRTQVFERLMNAVMSNDMVAVKPASIKIFRVSKDVFRISVCDAKGEELNRCMDDIEVGVGNSLTLCDVHRAFEVTINGGPAKSFP
jgi:riboflavin synthase alpha subunit